MHLETERLIIREFNADTKDVAFVLEILNTEGWLAYIGDRNIRTMEEANKYVQERFLDKYPESNFVMHAVDEKDSGNTVGMVGLVKRDYLDQPDIGYALLPAYSGKGYALEAANAVLNYAKKDLQFTNIYAIVVPHNHRSILLLQKMKFEFQREFDENNTRLCLYLNT